MSENSYQILESDDHSPIKAWVNGVNFEHQAQQQLRRIASLPFIHHHIAAMPDVHLGIGATVGSVIATKGAVVPSAVGVDIGCGMAAVPTSLMAEDLPDSLKDLRFKIEEMVPHGGPGVKGSWDDKTWGASTPRFISKVWKDSLRKGYKDILDKHDVESTLAMPQLGSLGGGNHFVEICLDEGSRVWIMLHSGSRGAGNQIGQHFIKKARELALRLDRRLPDKDLGWFGANSPDKEERQLFEDYVEAVRWGQNYARLNRDLMMVNVIEALRLSVPKPFTVDVEGSAVNCHHNYVSEEEHFGEKVFVTRKGAVSAKLGQLGIIPGSMGTRSYIVRGKGNADSFSSCSHGAGRCMSRGEAKRTFTVEDHIKATEGVECRKDEGVIDEIPMAYKDIDAVMRAQEDLVETVHELRQVVCVKG